MPLNGSMLKIHIGRRSALPVVICLVVKCVLCIDVLWDLTTNNVL